MRAPMIEPTVTPYDAPGAERKLDHPAFGTISASRISGRTHLVGSHVEHSGFVRIEIKRASCHADAYSESYFGRELVARLDLTEAQWVNLVARMNQGQGTPCTLRLVGTGPLEELPELASTMKLDERLADGATRMNAELDKLIATQVAEMRKVADKLGKKDSERFLMDLRVLEDNFRANAKFHHVELTEKKETLVVEAKLEIEAAINSKITALGIESLQQLANASHKQIEGES
jgi:hypothetical protein